MRFDVRERHREQRLAVDAVAVARQHASLVDEQAVIGAVGDLAVTFSGKDCAVLADVQRVVARAQANLSACGSFNHGTIEPLGCSRRAHWNYLCPGKGVFASQIKSHGYIDSLIDKG